MKIGYFSTTSYKHGSPLGGYAHMRQFLAHASELGHDLLLIHGGQHPSPRVKAAPTSRLGRFMALRQMDVLYYRVEYKPPRDVKWVLPPRRSLLVSPLVVWEFNSVPEYARLLGEDDRAVEGHIASLKHFGAGCDLAVCVSDAISDYVKTRIGLKRVMTAPNGSDPDLFRPDAPPVKRIIRHPGRLNVVWMGSAEVKWHNFELLRDAAWLLWNNGDPLADFHILGQGMVGLRDLPANVHYHGAEQYDKLPGWLSAMDVGLNVYRPGPADYSCPLKLFDYMASGLALVSTDQPQVRDIFRQLGQEDWIVPSGGSAEALAEILRKIAADPQRRAKQGAAARELAVKTYNWAKTTRDTLDAIESLRREKAGT
jgi:glycosyltransferase involved in cell wall biosynthesis